MLNNLCRLQRVALLCFVSVLMPTAKAYATIILVVVKPDAIWIGADARRSGLEEWGTVCKAHVVYGGVLLKFGIDQDNARTFSSDADIKKLLETEKTFDQFEQAAAKVLRVRVQQQATRMLADIKSQHPEFFIGDTIRIKPLEKDAFLIDMGLAFITVLDGKPAIYELIVTPTPEVVVGLNGSVSYRWVVDQPIWHIREPKEEVLEYPLPPKGRTILSEVQTRLIGDPQTQIPRTIFEEESYSVCGEGPPNLLYKISATQIDPKKHYSARVRLKLRQTANIEFIEPGACPSWEFKPIARPEACTMEQEKREHGFK